jgi:hypothetical protein
MLIARLLKAAKPVNALSGVQQAQKELSYSQALKRFGAQRQEKREMQRSYEVMFIVRPDLLEEDVDKLIATLQGHATAAGATVEKAEKMGKRRLAYDV